MSEADFEINACLDYHWHQVITGNEGGCFGPQQVTYEMCSDPCVRADSSVYILPAVGPTGVEVRHRLRFPGGITAEQMRQETERAWRDGHMANEHLHRIAISDDG